MTSLIAWAGMDPHGQTSLYFATDSRISWSVAPPYWDFGRKVFACRFEPDIFAFTGEGLFSVTVISRLCSLIDDGLVSSATRSSLTTRCQWVSDIIREAFRAHPPNHIKPFVIFYGTRIGTGTQPNSLLRQKAKTKAEFDPFLGSWFGCQTVSWDGSQFASDYVTAPYGQSQHLAADGTGKKWVEEHQARTADDPQYRTSRIVFRAFCDSLIAAKDKQSGGYPQLVGLYRGGAAKTLGIVTKGRPTYLGLCHQFPEKSKVEWRNEDFERCNELGERIDGAQQHHFG